MNQDEYIEFVKSSNPRLFKPGATLKMPSVVLERQLRRAFSAGVLFGQQDGEKAATKHAPSLFEQIFGKL